MSRIIVALDNMSMPVALGLTEKVRSCVWGVKANSLLLSKQEMNLNFTCVEHLKACGVKVFADPKFDDIPQTVSNGVTELAQQGADLITAKSTGGPDMMRAAVDAYEKNRPVGGLGILAVTLLTSITPETCDKYYRRTPEQTVLMFAEEAAEAGVYGFVCSPKELAILHGKFPKQKRVTPGVRSPGAETHDQQRFDTPKNAVLNGTDFLVIGREATQSQDPVATCKRINSDVELYR